MKMQGLKILVEHICYKKVCKNYSNGFPLSTVSGSLKNNLETLFFSKRNEQAKSTSMDRLKYR